MVAGDVSYYCLCDAADAFYRTSKLSLSKCNQCAQEINFIARSNLFCEDKFLTGYEIGIGDGLLF